MYTAKTVTTSDNNVGVRTRPGRRLSYLYNIIKVYVPTKYIKLGQQAKDKEDH